MKYYVALFEKLKLIYQAQTSATNEVALICPSSRIYEKNELELLKPDFVLTDPSKIAESYLKKQDASYQLNSVPVSNTFWDVNPSNSLFNVYRDILNSIQLDALQTDLNRLLSIDTSVIYDEKGKETKDYKAYLKFLKIYEQKLTAIAEHLELYEDDFSDDQKQNWNEILSNLTKRKDLSVLELEIKGFKAAVEKALENINHQTDRDQFIALVQSAKFEFDAAEKTDIISNNSMHNINFIPYDFMDSENGWTHLELNKTELDSLYDLAKNHSEHLPQEIINFNYDEKFIKGIELDYQFVTLKRNWFNKNIFSSPLFKTNDAKPVSDGQNISNEYRLSAFPKTMILIKNLFIDLDNSVTTEQIENPLQLVNFGPLILKQQIFINKSNNKKFLKAVTSKDTLTSDHVNYYKKKSDIEPVFLKPTVIKEESIVRSAGVVTPVATTSTPKPTSVFIKPISATTIKPVLINPGLFTPVSVAVSPTTASVKFKTVDRVTKNPVYKCNISIKGNDNRIFAEIETNQNGEISKDLPTGNYEIKLMADDYEILTKNITVENLNPKNFEFEINRDQVKYRSYFLIGMICEMIPKTI